MNKLPKVGDIEVIISLSTKKEEYQVVTDVRPPNKIESKFFPHQKFVRVFKTFKTLADAKQFAKTVKK
jgi:hypothetical protein